MMVLYGSSILMLEHKTDNDTRSSDHLHQHHGEVRQAQQKACHIRKVNMDRTSGLYEIWIKGKTQAYKWLFGSVKAYVQKFLNRLGVRAFAGIRSSVLTKASGQTICSLTPSVSWHFHLLIESLYTWLCNYLACLFLEVS